MGYNDELGFITKFGKNPSEFMNIHII